MIQVRADLTEAEWAAVRKLAIDRGQPVAHTVRDALLAFLDQHTANPSTEGSRKA